jgi:hypothetical protein
MERLRLLGAAGGAVSAILVVIAYAIAPGPSSANGETVFRYYSAHGTAVAWQAALVGISVVLFIWFAETFAGFLSAGPVAVVGAAVIAALSLVTIGCWEVLGETFNGVGRFEVGSEDFGDAHFLYDAGARDLPCPPGGVRTDRPNEAPRYALVHGHAAVPIQPSSQRDTDASFRCSSLTVTSRQQLVGLCDAASKDASASRGLSMPAWRNARLRRRGSTDLHGRDCACHPVGACHPQT